MTLEVRPCTSEEYLLGLAPIFQFFGHPPDEDTRTHFEPLLPAERVIAAWLDGGVVGGSGAFPFGLSVPGGGEVAAAGVTVVGVSPTHRRRGILRAMMRAQLDAAHSRGEPVAVLWASEGAIYGRFGFGLASLSGELNLPRAHARLRGDGVPGARVRQVSADEAAALFPAVHEAVRRVRPGMPGRSEDWWLFRTLSDPEWQRDGGGVKMFAVAEVDGHVEGYATYRHHQRFDHGVSVGRLQIVEALGSTPAGTDTIWRYLLAVDWVERYTAGLLPVDHELNLLLAEQRRARLTVGDALYVRLVDVGAALAARAFGEGEVDVEVADGVCPWNAGVWRIGGGGASRVEAEPELRLDVRELGSVYLGGFTLADLARAALVEELAPGAIARADTVFASDAKPWCPEIF
jgi:predicted acetyltransferase